MKKMLKNRKGFSLIELLIVIAIMGVLAVIAFSMFSGVVANSRKKADNAQAGNIQKALVAYMVDTGDTYLENLKYTAPSVAITDTNADTGTKITAGTHTWENVVIALQRKQKVEGQVYEPFLNPKSGTTPSSTDFKVQWTGHYGYLITVIPERSNATVEPAKTTSDNKIILPTR